MFLVALCLSIFLEAIQRFVEKPEVSNPKLILIVGCFGLASNIIGLFLFHEHGHGHSHGHGDEISSAEEGHSHGVDAVDHAVADEGGNIEDVLPQTRVAGYATISNGQQKPGTKPGKKPSGDISWNVSDRSPRKSATGKRIPKSHGRSRSRGYSGLDEIYVHPSSFRNSIIQSSHLESSDDESDENETAVQDEPTEQSPLLQKAKSQGSDQSKRDCHKDHKHNQPKDEAKGGHGHSHGDLNMRGVFLHVMGDALGNIGVIGSALIIWLTSFSWRFYADPVISLVITLIILMSAIPLCKAASRILLQAVPAGLSIDDIRDDITDLDGIVSCHHVHVWQLSDSKLIASLHVQVDFDFEGAGSARYMDLARQIRRCLHEYGIHSSTIQPEFCLDPNHDHSAANTDDERAGSSASSANASKTASVRGSDACLLECGDACGDGNQCCVPGAKECQSNR